MSYLIDCLHFYLQGDVVMTDDKKAMPAITQWPQQQGQKGRSNFAQKFAGVGELDQTYFMTRKNTRARAKK